MDRPTSVPIGHPVAQKPGKLLRGIGLGGARGPNLMPADLSAALQAAPSAGVTVSATQITFSAAASLARARIVPTAPIANGGTYELKYRVSGRSAGSTHGIVYGTSQNGSGTIRNADGSYTDTVLVTPGGSFNQCLAFQADSAGTTLVIDQIELRQVF